MNRFVLDTSALLALLFGEPGADFTTARGENGLVSAVCYSEAIAKSLDRSVPQETIAELLTSLNLTIIPFDQLHAGVAASLRPATRGMNFSFADRACLATGSIANLPVLTGDRDWANVDVGVEVVVIR